jgi:hypothetical protein
MQNRAIPPPLMDVAFATELPSLAVWYPIATKTLSGWQSTEALDSANAALKSYPSEPKNGLRPCR